MTTALTPRSRPVVAMHASKRGSSPVIDWIIAEKIATYVAGEGDAPEPHGGAGAARGRRRDPGGRLHATGAGRELPAPEGISRREWVAANLGSMRRMLDPVLERAGEKLGSPRGARSLGVSLVSTTEVGVVVGFLAQRVLGQYELVLLEEASDDNPPRLLFVLPNLSTAVRALKVPKDEFLTWVTLHEVTHAVQFSAVPWLQPPHGRPRLRAAALDGAADRRRRGSCRRRVSRRRDGSRSPSAAATSSGSSPPRASARRSTGCRRRWP